MANLGTAAANTDKVITGNPRFLAVLTNFGNYQLIDCDDPIFTNQDGSQINSVYDATSDTYCPAVSNNVGSLYKLTIDKEDGATVINSATALTAIYALTETERTLLAENLPAGDRLDITDYNSILVYPPIQSSAVAMNQSWSDTYYHTSPIANLIMSTKMTDTVSIHYSYIYREQPYSTYAFVASSSSTIQGTITKEDDKYYFQTTKDCRVWGLK